MSQGLWFSSSNLLFCWIFHPFNHNQSPKPTTSSRLPHAVFQFANSSTRPELHRTLKNLNPWALSPRIKTYRFLLKPFSFPRVEIQNWHHPIPCRQALKSPPVPKDPYDGRFHKISRLVAWILAGFFGVAGSDASPTWIITSMNWWDFMHFQQHDVSLKMHHLLFSWFATTFLQVTKWWA